MSSSRKASTARSKSRASRRDPDDVAESHPTAAAEPAPTAAAATSTVVAAPAPANPFGVDPEASVTVVDTNGNHNDPDDDLTQAELAVKYKIELTGDPFIDSDRLQEAKSALAPAPKAKRHRAEGTAAPRRGKHKEDEANTVTRLKTITATEKKGVAALRQVIGLLAREIALRTNRVPQLVADITAVLNHVAEAVSAATLTQGGQADDSTAGQDGDAPAATAEPVTFIPLPPCDVPALLGTVIEAARKSAEAWAADPDGQIELDDELLRSIAHVAAKALNAMEGFVAPPDLVVSEKGRAARLKLIAAAKERELKLQGKLAEKERVELEKQRQRQREEMQAKAVKGLGVEDADLDHPSPIMGVACAPVPLLSVELFEAALRVWSVVTSAPKMTKVTQMPFTTFIMGLKDNTSGGTIMRDVVRGLVEAAGGGDIADSRASVKSWLGPCLVFMTDRMDAIVAAAAAEVSRAKVKPKPKAPKKVAGTGGRGIRRHHASSSEDDSDDDGDSDDTDDDDDDDDEEEESDPDALDDTADAELDDDGDEVKDAPEDEGDDVKDETKEGGEAVIRKPRPETPMQAARRQAEERLAHVRALVEQYSPTRMCSWVQLTIAERLRLLTFLTEVLLQSDGFVAHMASVEERCRIEQNKFDARVKQIRDDAEKAKKVLRQQQRDADPKTHKKDKNATGSPLPEAAPEEAAAPPPTNKGSKKGAAASPASPAPPKLLTEAEYAAKRTQIDEKAEKAVEQAYAAFRAKLDKEDFGTRIKPLGRDRYKRLVWYFPQDRRLLVQHVPGSTEAFTDAANGRSPTSGMLPPIVTRVAEWGTPALAPPVATKSLIDDEVVDFRRTRGAMRDSAPVEQPQDTEEELGILLGGGADHKAQTTWAFVAASDLRAYVESLDERGLREGPLRAAVKLLIPHITAVDMAVEAVRASRRTNVNFGYFNQLREKSWGW